MFVSDHDVDSGFQNAPANRKRAETAQACGAGDGERSAVVGRKPIPRDPSGAYSKKACICGRHIGEFGWEGTRAVN